MTRAPGSVRGRYRRIHLIAGPPAAGPGGIQEAFIAQVKRLKAGDPLRPLSVLVGSNYLRLHLQRLLAVRLGGHANIVFRLLRDLAREHGTAPLVDRGRRKIPEHGRDLLLAEAVRVRSHGSYFERIAGKPGFLEALGATIRDLKDGGIEPATLRAAAAARRDPLIRGKLEDLADLHEAYDDLLRDRRFYDDEDLMRSAAGIVANASEEPLIVYGFYDATWLQRSLLQDALAYRPGIVFFPFEPAPHEATWEYARPLLDWFRSFIPEVQELPSREEPSPRDVRMLSAPGEARETVEAIRWLVAQAREKSVPFGEMGLVYRASEPYARLAAEVMAEAGGVPHFLSEGTPLAASGAGRALLLLLELRAGDLARRRVIDFLALTRRDNGPALWDRLSREAGVVKGIDDWRERLETLARRSGRPGSSEPEESRAVRDLSRQVGALHAALERLPQVGSWREMAEAATDLLERFLPDDPSTGTVGTALTRLGALDQVSTPVPLDAFIERCRRVLEESGAPREGQFQRSGIFVGDVMQARLLNFHALAVVGLVEKVFPVPPRQDPILLDEERTSINDMLREDRLPLKTRRLDEERLLFRIARAGAAESLLLCYPRLDAATARSRNPSPFLLGAAASLAGEPVDYERLDRLDRMTRVPLSEFAPSEPSNALFPREFDLGLLAAATREGSEPETARRAAALASSNPILARALLAERERWGEDRFTAHDGVMLRPSVSEALRSMGAGPDEAISATRIEEYASCPLAYFLGRVLKLRAAEEPEEVEEIDSRDRGALVHRILHDLYSTLREKGHLPLTPQKRPGALALLDRVAARRFEEQERAGVTGYALLWNVEKERILEDLRSVVAREADRPEGFVPAFFEIRYGRKRREDAPDDPASTDASMPLDLGRGRVAALEGRIDRVDLAPDATTIRITDYKSGKMDRYKDDRLRGGTTVQLPLYMVAAEAMLNATHPGVKAEQARYLSVDRRGGFREVTFSREALANRREDLARTVETFRSGTARGVFFAYPERETCTRCDFRLACGEGREARFARKRADGTAADFLRMREGIE